MEPHRSTSVQEPAGASTPRSRWRGRAIEVLTTALLAATLWWVTQAFLLQTYRVEGASMDETLRDGHHLLIDKLTPRITGYGRGDIVVLRPPDCVHGDAPYIKRVVGVSGDKIELSGGRVLVNGNPLDEPYLKEGTLTDDTHRVTRWDIDEGSVFVLGDNREGSVDSRCFGEVATDALVGRALLRFWPPGAIGAI